MACGNCAQIMKTDPYFLTQDNGSGAPIHFAVRYSQLDMVPPRRHPAHSAAVRMAR